MIPIEHRFDERRVSGLSQEARDKIYTPDLLA
jgi:hypothetical protein